MKETSTEFESNSTTDLDFSQSSTKSDSFDQVTSSHFSQNDKSSMEPTRDLISIETTREYAETTNQEITEDTSVQSVMRLRQN